MAFSLSPGVSFSEVDLTTIAPAVFTTNGAFCGYFPWGPVNQVTFVDTENTLANRFLGGTWIGPDSNSAVQFFTCANFLKYGNSLQVVRTVGANANNAVSGTGQITLNNETSFQATYLGQNNANTYGPFVARYPGALGNSISVAVCGNTSLFSTWTFAGYNANSYFNAAPATSAYASGLGGSNDQIHIAVIDSGGLISGVKNTVLEVWPFLSKASDGTNLLDATSSYYKQVLFNKSKYIYAMDPPEYTTTNTTWGRTVSSVGAFANLLNNDYFTLTKGADDIGTDANLQTSWNYFNSKETTDISLVLTGAPSTATQQYIVNSVVGSRNDCIAFLSPPQSAVVNNAGNELSAIQTWLSSLAVSSSYAVADSGWKYQLDQYTNVYRWIPLNGDIAGLCVNTDAVAYPWFSPAGFNRGAIKNVIKLSWNPAKAIRDQLYTQGVNPVISYPGQGVVLFGDKTLQTQPSAFDRINVRRLFLVLEKSITKAAQYSLFEFNDGFTQSQFINLVTPFLRSVQGARGITDFRVVCDSTNNTPDVINANQFVGDIYIKPNRSVNFIQLNFVAVNNGVDFTTVVGAR